MIRIDLDPSELLALGERMPRLRRPIQRAQVRAVNKTLRSLRTRAIRDVAHAANVPQKVLRGRGGGRGRAFIRKARGRDVTGALWFGTASIAAAYLGNPRQFAYGARVGRRKFPGAFVATMPSGHVGVFRRGESARHRPARNAWGTTALPIKEVGVDLDGARAAINRLRPYARRRLTTVLDQELNYALNVRGIARR